MLTTLVKFVQDIVMPLGLLFQHLRADGGGEFITDYDRNYCTTEVSLGGGNDDHGSVSTQPSAEQNIFFLVGHPLQCLYLLRQQEGFAPTRAGKLQQSKQTRRDQVHRAPQLDRGCEARHQPRLDQGPAERHLPFDELFFDAPAKISIFLALSLSFLFE